MLLKTLLETELHSSMKKNDELQKNTIRMILAAMKFAEIEKHNPLSDDEVISIIQKEIKIRNETISEIGSSGRNDLIQKAESELKILEHFLPSQLSDQELLKLAEIAVKENEAIKISDMGRVMKSLLPEIKGRATPERASTIIKNLLSK